MPKWKGVNAKKPRQLDGGGVAVALGPALCN
jgi:hypothetical protein